MRWIDMHCDTLSELCGREGENLYHNSLCVDIGRLEQAGAELQFFACFVDAAAYGGTEEEKTWDRAWENVLELIRRAKEQEGEAFRFLRDPGEMLTQKRHVRGILTVEEGGVPRREDRTAGETVPGGRAAPDTDVELRELYRQSEQPGSRGHEPGVEAFRLRGGGADE